MSRDLIDPGLQADADEVGDEINLRPSTLDEYVGQRAILENLQVFIEAAKQRNEALDHLLFAGPPGLGKTTLAHVITREMGVQLKATSGPVIERGGDLAAIVSNLEEGDVLFIDEIHRLNRPVQEVLYPAMEDYEIDIVLGQGPAARALKFQLPPFTLVGATTREGLLSAPFRGRFGLLERLAPYPTTDLVEILRRSARILGLDLSPEGARAIAERSRGTPRVANRFLRRVRDLAQVQGIATADAALSAEALERLGVDANGLEEIDRRILSCLARSEPEPLGLKTIAAAVGESEDTIEDVFEPHLLRQGFVQKTARGRRVTSAGRVAIGLPPGDGPGGGQGSLFVE